MPMTTQQVKEVAQRAGQGQLQRQKGSTTASTDVGEGRGAAWSELHCDSGGKFREFWNGKCTKLNENDNL